MLSIGSTRQNRPLIASRGGSCRGSQPGTGGPSGGSSGVLFIFEQSRFHRYKRRYPKGPWIGQVGERGLLSKSRRSVKAKMPPTSSVRDPNDLRLAFRVRNNAVGQSGARDMILVLDAVRSSVHQLIAPLLLHNSRLFVRHS